LSDLPGWWTLDDVAAYLDVKQSTLRAYVARNQMPQPDRRLGRRWLWQRETIEQWRPRP
jgi:excisionase family DNA binding protein